MTVTLDYTMSYLSLFYSYAQYQSFPITDATYIPTYLAETFCLLHIEILDELIVVYTDFACILNLYNDWCRSMATIQ